MNYDKAQTVARRINRSLDNVYLGAAIAALELIEKGFLSVDVAKGILTSIRDSREALTDD